MASQNARPAQKLRTRQALLAAARDMMSRQEAITVSSVAKAAGISNATAYRYFSDPETIRLEAVIELNLGATGNFMEDLEARCEGVTSVLERALEAQRLMTEFVENNEDAYRLFLAKGHEQVVAHRGKDKPAPRGGRRIPMIEFALEPWRMDLTGRQFMDAVVRVATVCGTESFFVLGDLCGVPIEERRTISEDVLRRTLKSIAADLGMPLD